MPLWAAIPSALLGSNVLCTFPLYLFPSCCYLHCPLTFQAPQNPFGSYWSDIYLKNNTSFIPLHLFKPQKLFYPFLERQKA